MTATVFFATIRARSETENTFRKIEKLCRALDLPNILKDCRYTAIKLHFGERGNDAYIRPPHVRPVVDAVRAAGCRPFLTDTNTLYSGSRKNAPDHLETAIAHGFVHSVVNAPVIIADGLTGASAREVPVKLKHFQSVLIATEIAQADSMIVLSHFKGHIMAGFGGAIKNLAMGCACVAGKRAQHYCHAFSLPEKCTGCGRCVSVCPESAISLTADKKAQVAREQCIGCFECVSVCPVEAMTVDWRTKMPGFMERMTEYAYGAVVNKKEHTAYISFLLNVTPDCDCNPWSDSPLVQDIGLLASTDPVAIDQASLDLVNAQHALPGTMIDGDCGPGRDKFKAVWKNSLGDIQLSYGEAIGLGTTKYELVDI